MKLKLYYGYNADLVDAEEYHLDEFPTLKEFLTLDNRVLRNVSLVAVGDMLPLLKLRLEDKPGASVKWTHEGLDLIDPETCQAVHFMLKIQ